MGKEERKNVVLVIFVIVMDKSEHLKKKIAKVSIPKVKKSKRAYQEKNVDFILFF